ncbi:probable G-protein coupled receptor B0563.6 [Paramacrobiotus metropolitanus]|uniref:probable G-protein coupled receptor B0563.6 n=1 Tax=Paramacrobiotus metropolitanus TaxID=2943436 RepID=UPI002445651E|nr:probable G-protein coupled receptor B0563.6 [Paramacrobiotus metropolitanus]
MDNDKLLYCTLPLDNSSVASNETRSADDIAVEKVERILYGILMPILSGLGIIGNILNLVVLTRPNLMKIITYTYFRAMAISDLLTMIMVIPFVAELSGAAFPGYTGNLFHAHVLLPCLNALVGSSVLCIVAVTFERWLSICHPMHAKNIQSPLRAKIIIAAGWVISFALYLPYCFRKSVQICHHPLHGGTGYVIVEDEAFTHSRGYVVYGWVRETVLRLLPMAILAVLNLRIVLALRKVQSRRRKLKGSTIGAGSKKRKESERAISINEANETNRQSISSTPAAKAEFKRLQEERRLVLLLIGIVVMFFVCVTPAAILLIIPVRDEDFGFGLKLFRAFANLLELTNYALNFYVYVGCSSDFRTTFANVFCSPWTKRMYNNGDMFERSVMMSKAPLTTAGDRSRKSTIDMTGPMDHPDNNNVNRLRRPSVDTNHANHHTGYEKVITITTANTDGQHERQELLKVEEVCV